MEISMKLLLTSNGISNPSIEKALRDLLGKPTEESRMVFVPTAANAERGDKSWLVKDIYRSYKLGWKKFKIVDVAALASLPRDFWWPAFERADVILVGGGNSFYLSYWLEQSGLAAALPEFVKDKVYVGISAGSMAVSKGLKTSSAAFAKFGEPFNHDNEYDELAPTGQALTQTVPLVDFYFRPHFNSEHFPKIIDENLQELAKALGGPLYALDDASALQVTGGEVTAVGEGEWRLYNDKK
jgi:dipeptidase E